MRTLAILLITSQVCFGQAIPSARRIASPTPVFTSEGTTLNTGLVAFWKLDETTGNRADSEPTGTPQTLTSVDSVGSAAGKITNAATFTSTMYLFRSDSADLSGGDTDFSVGAWVYITDTNGTRTVLAKYTTTPSALREYDLDFSNGSARFRFFVSNNGSGGANVTIVSANTFGAPVINTWYYVAAGHDSVNNLIWISVNNGTRDTAAHTTGVFDGTSEFTIGATGDHTSQTTGRVDEAGFWRKVLTTAEVIELYNSGTGKTCCAFP